MDALVGPMALPPVPGFGYDAAGNRTVERRPGEPVRTYTANELDQYTVVAGAARLHDANGNLTDDGTHRYVYDAGGRLSRVIDAASGQELWRAVHDALGRRVLEVEGGAVRRLVYSGDTLIAEHGPEDPVVHYVAGPTPDRILQIAAAGEEHWVHTDLVGSTRLLTDPDGNVTAAFGYSPFGQLLDGTPPEGVRILYTGRRIDPTGTYEHRARSYSPDTGRFCSATRMTSSTGRTSTPYAAWGQQPTVLRRSLGRCARNARPVSSGRGWSIPGVAPAAIRQRSTRTRRAS